MVAVVQLVEHQVVILAVAGSSPVSHPAEVGGLSSPPTFFFRRNDSSAAFQSECGIVDARAALVMQCNREAGTARLELQTSDFSRCGHGRDPHQCISEAMNGQGAGGH